MVRYCAACIAFARKGRQLRGGGCVCRFILFSFFLHSSQSIFHYVPPALQKCDSSLSLPPVSVHPSFHVLRSVGIKTTVIKFYHVFPVLHHSQLFLHLLNFHFYLYSFGLWRICFYYLFLHSLTDSIVWLRCHCRSLTKFICAINLPFNSPNFDYMKFLDYLTSKPYDIFTLFPFAEISIRRDLNVHH